MEYAKFMDPVYAAYLVDIGRDLKGIEPSSREEPKYYLFDKSVNNGEIETDFLGFGKESKSVQWSRFISAMSRLLKAEDMQLRQISDRVTTTGRDARQGDDCVYKTADQGVAAFLLGIGLTCVGVSSIGKDKGYMFMFKEYELAEEAYQQMLNGAEVFYTSWWIAKCCWKRATQLRLHAVNHKETNGDKVV